jgi:hypothetical protein
MGDNDLMLRSGEMSVPAVKQQVDKIQQLMKDIMREGEHYGKIPGTDKPTLLKAGAEKLDFTFRLLPRYKITRNELPNNHREYEIVCELYHQSGTFAGEGVGNCSTMETKYRYRNIADFEDTGEPIPADSKERKQEYRKLGFGMKKINGQWAWVKYKDSARQENPDIADTYNTVLKMAKKRALVDATITACAASDIFTQDIGDPEEEPIDDVKSEETQQQEQHTKKAESELEVVKTAVSRIWSRARRLDKAGKETYTDDKMRSEGFPLFTNDEIKAMADRATELKEDIEGLRGLILEWGEWITVKIKEAK